MSSTHSPRVVIVGGAIIGSFCAWSLRQAGFAGPITVVEKDASYQFSSTALSAASIRTQFGTAANIRMSLYGARMFRDVKAVFGDQADIGYRERGYLILGGHDQVTQRLEAVRMQRSHGADIRVLDPDELAARYPGVDFGDVGIGTLGVQHEGWFDAWSLLSEVRRSARRLGVDYVEAKASGFRTHGARVTGVELSNGEVLACDFCVLAAGALSGRLAALLDIALPVVPKKRTVFSFKTPFKASELPMLFDSSGIWVRPEGEGFIGGIQPPAEIDGDADGDFEPHHDLMESLFWPLLAKRIPAMEELRLQRAWAGHYEVNTLDHNGVVGPHDELGNLIFATGFSGHGVMHAPAVGRGVAELITTGAFRSIDMSPLGWARIRSATPLFESIVY
ncbi:FAD-binding oxidoreductase [Variovorax sp.]|uniref:NAD(P)/FAD-dependent oxidoreductase n=1 Tax=Variovorax sp. TaxID=1871043 RepID=UPI00137FC9D5|nr:FAD-binding oxidoreductase [Variovorax sp.]KAF1070865.1 MAG: 4-methylaminobutanoate oxidase (formaldehyde-forming) [Variovorax sp.]